MPGADRRFDAPPDGTGSNTALVCPLWRPRPGQAKVALSQTGRVDPRLPSRHRPDFQRNHSPPRWRCGVPPRSTPRTPATGHACVLDLIGQEPPDLDFRIDPVVNAAEYFDDIIRSDNRRG